MSAPKFSKDVKKRIIAAAMYLYLMWTPPQIALNKDKRFSSEVIQRHVSSPLKSSLELSVFILLMNES